MSMTQSSILFALVAAASGCALNTAGAELTGESQQAQQAPTGVGVTFRPPPVADPLVDIGSGGGHFCVRRALGRVWCWGRNDSGQTGGTPISINGFWFGGVSQPTLVPGLNAAHIAIGNAHSCALTSAGQALCWGSNWDGALGSNTTNPPQTPTPVANFNGAPITFSNLGAGDSATCGVEAGTGKVFCWGELFSNGAFQNPTPLLTQTGFLLTNAIGVVTGKYGGCVTWGIASQPSGTSSCWDTVDVKGDSDIGAVNLNWGFGQHVSTSNDFSCADLTDGTVMCFGADDYGELGDGIQGSSSSNPPQVVGLSATTGAGMQLRRVSAGSRHACALDPSNNLVCWGANDQGQLGNGTHANLQAPTPVTSPSGIHFKAVAAGEDDTCAIGSDDHVYCWGSNTYFESGTGSVMQNANFLVPTRTIDPM
jgi:alpha-tubulin suppressor-like RCC1 family protein